MNWLSLRNNQLKFKTLGEILIVLEELREYTLMQQRKNQKTSTCDRWDLETPGSRLIMPQNPCSDIRMESCEGRGFVLLK